VRSCTVHNGGRPATVGFTKGTTFARYLIFESRPTALDFVAAAVVLLQFILADGGNDKVLMRNNDIKR